MVLLLWEEKFAVYERKNGLATSGSPPDIVEEHDMNVAELKFLSHYIHKRAIMLSGKSMIA